MRGSLLVCGSFLCVVMLGAWCVNGVSVIYVAVYLCGSFLCVVMLCFLNVCQFITCAVVFYVWRCSVCVYSYLLFTHFVRWMMI